jgi:hypothetical protein
MAADKYPAETFVLWLEHMRNPDGSPWSKSKAARELGCARNQISIWSDQGAPYYIGLACQSLAMGKGAWVPFRKERLPWLIKPPKAPEPAAEPAPAPRVIKPELSPKERAARIKGIRWTKAG